MASEYDVALSFAGEQRDYVEEVAQGLRLRGVRVFYDLFEQANLWGKDLSEHLDYVYRRAARFCVLFASRDYEAKMWTTHERRSAQARAIEEHSAYVLPARFDDTEIPGLLPTVGYIDLRMVGPTALVELISQKIGPQQRENFFPPVPDRLVEGLGLHADWAPNVVDVAHAAFESLRRLDPSERRLIIEIFTRGCPSDLPVNMHINLDLVRRDLGLPPAEALELLSRMRSVGFEWRMRGEDDEEGNDVVEVEWHDMSVKDDGEAEGFADDWSTQILEAMLSGVARRYCLECGFRALSALDFAQLSSSAVDDGGHYEPA